MLISAEEPQISIARQCDLLGISRSGYYYQEAEESPEDLLLKRLIDEEYTRRPFYGSRRMKVTLEGMGYSAGRDRIRRLMREMGLEAMYPKPRTTQSSTENRKYPYLLRGVVLNRPNQVWSVDITYIRLLRGFLYLVAIIDWYSRYVLAWEISNSLESHFCMEVLKRALRVGKPDIFNSDQGVQFTRREFTDCLESNEIRISQDGRGRALDNVFVERLWRSVKYEEVYLKDYQTIAQALEGLSAYFDFYNDQRPHQSLDYRVPKEVHFHREEQMMLALVA